MRLDQITFRCFQFQIDTSTMSDEEFVQALNHFKILGATNTNALLDFKERKEITCLQYWGPHDTITYHKGTLSDPIYQAHKSEFPVVTLEQFYSYEMLRTAAVAMMLIDSFNILRDGPLNHVSNNPPEWVNNIPGLAERASRLLNGPESSES